MLGSHTPLHAFVAGTVTVHPYRDKILEADLRLFRCAVSSDFIFLDNNAKPLRGILVDDFLEEENILLMNWPSRSLDQNPIEHIWDSLEKLLHNIYPVPGTNRS